MCPVWYWCSLKFWLKNQLKTWQFDEKYIHFCTLGKYLRESTVLTEMHISVAVSHSWHDFRIWREVSPLQTCSVNTSMRAEPLYTLGPCSNVSVLRVKISEQFQRRWSKFQFCNPTPGVPIADFKLRDAAVSKLRALVYSILPPTTALIFVCHRYLETSG